MPQCFSKRIYGQSNVRPVMPIWLREAMRGSCAAGMGMIDEAGVSDHFMLLTTIQVLRGGFRPGLQHYGEAMAA